MCVFDKPAGDPESSQGPCVHYEGNILNTHKGAQCWGVGDGVLGAERHIIGDVTSGRLTQRGIGGVTLRAWGP